MTGNGWWVMSYNWWVLSDFLWVVMSDEIVMGNMLWLFDDGLLMMVDEWLMMGNGLWVMSYNWYEWWVIDVNGWWVIDAV